LPRNISVNINFQFEFQVLISVIRNREWIFVRMG